MEDRIKNVMSQVLGIPVSSIDDDASPETLSKWDSLGHMNLCMALEEEFDLQFDDKQVNGMTSFPKILEAVGSLAKR